MFCTHYGAQIPDGSKFCTVCGAKVTVATVPLEQPDATSPAQATNLGGTAPADAQGPAPSGQAAADPSPAERPAAGQTAPYAAPQQTPYAPTPAQPYETLQGYPDQGKPERGGNRTAVIAAVVTVAVVAALFVALFLADPLHIFRQESTPAAATTTAASTSAATKSATTSRASSAASTAAATTQPATTQPTTTAPATTQAAASGYVLPDSDTRLYSKSELEGLSTDQLWHARNEIYARHGRGFQDPQLQAYFDAQPWYKKLYSPEEFDSMPDPLNSTEKQNADTIKSVEQEKGSDHL